jgi:hypothetical protein
MPLGHRSGKAAVADAPEPEDLSILRRTRRTGNGDLANKVARRKKDGVT